MRNGTLKSSDASRARLAAVQASEDIGPSQIRAAIEALNAAHREEVDAIGAQVAALHGMLDDMSQHQAAGRLGGGSSAQQSQVMAETAGYIRGVSASMSTASGPDGGFVVPEEVEQIVERTQRDFNPMRRLARSVVTAQPVWKKDVWLGGAGAEWVSESQSRPETDTPRMAEVSIPVSEIYANPRLTQNLVDDARVDVVGDVMTEVGIEFAAKESTAFVRGDGNKKPYGFLSYPVALTKDATRPFGTIQYVKSGDASGFVTSSATASPLDCLHKMVYALKPGYRANATWLMSSDTAFVVRTFKDSEGRYAWQSATKEGEPDRLLGYPVEIEENSDAVEADKFPIAFADWNNAYVVVDHPVMGMLRDAYTNKPHVHLYTTKRVGGGLYLSDAIKLLKIAS